MKYNVYKEKKRKRKWVEFLERSPRGSKKLERENKRRERGRIS